MTTAEKILRLLKELRLEQKSVAGAAGVAYPNFRAYLRDVSPSVPGVDVALKIARALNVPVDWLYDDDQDWPPPESNTPANIGPQELVAELARRRELIRKDMRAIAAEFPCDVLSNLNRMAIFDLLSGECETWPIEIEAALGRLLTYSALETQLEWLDPDAVHPTTKLEEVDKWLKDYDELYDAFTSARGEPKSGTPTSPLAAQRSNKRGEVTRHDRHGGTFPAHPHPPRSRSRSAPKRSSTDKKPTATKPKKPQSRPTGKRSAPAKPKRPPRA